VIATHVAKTEERELERVLVWISMNGVDVDGRAPTEHPSITLWDDGSMNSRCKHDEMRPRICIPLMCLAGCTSIAPIVSQPDASADADNGSDASPLDATIDAGIDVSEAARGDARVTGSVDHSKLGDACGRGLPLCPEGYRCARFTMDPDDPELKTPRCVLGEPCQAVTCFDGRICMSPLTFEDFESKQTVHSCDKF
jgi:hypothetical protein